MQVSLGERASSSKQYALLVSSSATALSSLRRMRAHLLNSSWDEVAASSARSLRMSDLRARLAADPGGLNAIE